MSPRRTPSPCTTPRCPNSGTIRGKCADHAVAADRQRGTATERGYGSRWATTRRSYLEANPQCSLCPAPANVPDHYPRSRRQLVADPTISDPDAWEHLRPLCKPCHDRETGRRRQ